MTRYSEPKIIAILRQAEGGVPVAELCREHGMSIASSSSAFSRLASDTVIPECFAFHAWNVPSDIPCLLQRSAHFAPASCTCKIPMICSFVRFAFFIVRPLYGPDSNHFCRKNPVAGHSLFAEAEVGGDHDTGAVLKFTNRTEEQCPANCA